MLEELDAPPPPDTTSPPPPIIDFIPKTKIDDWFLFENIDLSAPITDSELQLKEIATRLFTLFKIDASFVAADSHTGTSTSSGTSTMCTIKGSSLISAFSCTPQYFTIVSRPTTTMQEIYFTIYNFITHQWTCTPLRIDSLQHVVDVSSIFSVDYGRDVVLMLVEDKNGVHHVLSIRFDVLLNFVHVNQVLAVNVVETFQNGRRPFKVSVNESKGVVGVMDHGMVSLYDIVDDIVDEEEDEDME